MAPEAAMNVDLARTLQFVVIVGIIVGGAAPKNVGVKQPPNTIVVVQERPKRHTPFLPGDYWKNKRPEFGPTQTDLEVMVNGTVRLKCPITHVADSSISFVRQRDFHILTNGHTVYTNDQRIEIVHAAKSHDWILVIKRANLNDSGIYECQISTTSGSHSLVFHLQIVTPRARLEGHDQEFHLVRGSTISLTCIVDEAPSPPQYVFWYHEERMVNYDLKSDSSVSVVTKNGHSSKETRSTLTIQNATPENAGNYTCKPSNAVAASIQVFVSEDGQSEPLLRPDAKDHHSTPKHVDNMQDHFYGGGSSSKNGGNGNNFNHLLNGSNSNFRADCSAKIAFLLLLLQLSKSAF